MKTETSPWQIDGHRAILQTELLRTEVDLRSPGAGIENVVYEGVSIQHLRLLQVTPEPCTEKKNRLVESYVRGMDVVATYAPSPPRTAGPGICWRVVNGSKGVSGVELIISIQTDQLESDSRISNRSDVRASEVWWLAGQDQLEFQKLQLSPSTPWTTTGPDAAGAFLFRLTEPRTSYVEMVAPADFRAAELCCQDKSPQSVQLSYQLFPERIEKGVIRRARVRGLLLSREYDLDVARECYSQLLAATPPLTT